VLIDFGLARVAEDPRLTQTGWLLGTPGYLAPEILYGDDATVASDVHAWATTVAFAASGRPPYGKGPAMAIMDRVRRGEHNLSGVPAPLQGLLAECLASEPLERPAVIELRIAIDELRQHAHLARLPQPELWTQPVAPQADSTPATVQLPVTPEPAQVTPAQQTPVQPQPVKPRPEQPRPVEPRPAPQNQSWPVPRKAPSRAQVVLQLLGLGALTGALVAYAPYAGTALVATVVLLMRTASVSRQRHGRRRMIRGRPRWYDVPTTTLSMPGYLFLAFFGALTLITTAAFCGVAMFSLAYLLDRPVAVGLVMAGLGFAPVLWWGPGSGRLREMTRGLVDRTARSEFGGLLVVAMCALGTAVLLGLLFSAGPNWAPALAAPWS
jgi:cell division septation protein DedD